jgi:hypothetical protein
VLPFSILTKNRIIEEADENSWEANSLFYRSPGREKTPHSSSSQRQAFLKHSSTAAICCDLLSKSSTAAICRDLFSRSSIAVIRCDF